MFPVPVVRKRKLRYPWLRFVERKWGTSRYSGTMKWRDDPDLTTTKIKAWRIAMNIAKLPDLLRKLR